MGKSLNLFDLQLYARSEQEKCAPVLAQNLTEGNQWLEDSALENDTTRECNFPPLPENSSHKFIDLEEEENSIPKDHPNEHYNQR